MREFYNSCLEVDLGILRENAVKIAGKLKYGKKFMPVIKGNAHGYGTERVSRMLYDSLGIRVFACAQVVEGIKMRKAGITDADIILLGPAIKEGIHHAVEYDIQIPVYTKELADALNEEAKSHNKVQKAHIKIDVGLHRIGVLPENFEELLKYILTLENIEIDGIYAHFSNAYAVDDEITIKQYETYKKCVEKAKELGVDPKYKHICCSGGSTWVPDDISTHDRLGCMLIGFSPMENGTNPYGVEHASSWRAQITNICNLKKGDTIGYSTKKLEKDTKTATVNVGICDGFFKPLADCEAPVLVRGKRGKYISVCMDQLFIDVTGIECEIGDEVTIFGKDPSGAVLTTDELTSITGWGNTLFHGYLTDRVKREYINE